MLRIAKEKELGEVRLIESGFGFSIGDPTQWRLNYALAGGGPLMDVGIYSHPVGGDDRRQIRSP